jgi:hypothetical protein
MFVIEKRSSLSRKFYNTGFRCGRGKQAQPSNSGVYVEKCHVQHPTNRHLILPSSAVQCCAVLDTPDVPSDLGTTFEKNKLECFFFSFELFR